MSLARIRRNWEAFGREDPLWAILTWSDKQHGRWQLGEFFATGEVEVVTMLTRARALLPGLQAQRALDFGCGVGRLTRALAATFAEVHGVDVAASMIQKAQELEVDVPHPGSIHWHHNTHDDLRCFDDGMFDLIYSNITLQHLPRELAQRYVTEFARITAAGGLVVFQLPERLRRTRNRNPVRRALGYVTGPLRTWLRRVTQRGPAMEMHGTPRKEVQRWLAAAGLEVLAIDANTMAGADWDSALYYACRR